MRRGLLPRRLPQHLVRLGLRHPGVCVAGGVVAVMVAVLVVMGVHVETDVLKLVPRHDPVVREFSTTLERFGSVDILLVDVRIEPDTELEPVLAFADELATRLEAFELIHWVEYRLEDPSEAAVPLLDRATLFLGPEELDELMGRLDDRGLQEQALRLRKLLLAPQGAVMKEILRLDPFLLLPRILQRARVGGIGARFDPETGYLIDPGRKHLLMLAKPVRPAQDIAFDRKLEQGLRGVLEETRTAWAGAGWEGDPPRVEFAGGYVTALEDGRLIVQDLVVGTLGAAVGVMLLFLLAFRRPATLVYAAGPMVVGLALTVIFIGVALNTLNSATSAFAALLIGLGIDFVIVLYGRYVEERHRGAEHPEAVEAMGRHTGVGVMLGAVTTAATFSAFMITDFRGLAELGLITGVGILLFAATVFILLPALLTLFRKRRLAERLHLHSFGSDNLCRLALSRPAATVIVVVLVTLAAGAGMLELRFDDSIKNMRAPDNRGVVLREEIMDAFGLRFTPMMVRVDAADEAGALEATRVLLGDLEPLVDGENLAGIDTLVTLVPPRSDQEVVLARLRRLDLDPVAFRERFAAALRAAGLNPAAFSEGIDHLVAALEVDRPLGLDDLAGTALERAVERYVVRYQGGVSSVIYCFPPVGKWRRGAPPALEEAVARHPGAVLTGPNVVSARLRTIVWGDAGRAAALGLLLVLVLLRLDLGSWRDTGLAMVPLAVGMVWTLGAMGALGLEINLMNIFVMTMIIGIGVDYGVHLLHRWRESEGDTGAVAETSKAIAVAAFTTVVGFGSLILSHFPGLRTVGAAAILGALSTAVLAITLLPVLLGRVRR